MAKDDLNKASKSSVLLHALTRREYPSFTYPKAKDREPALEASQ